MPTATSSLLALLPDAGQRAQLAGIDLGPGLVLHICAAQDEAERMGKRIAPDAVIAGRGVPVAWLARMGERDPDLFRILFCEPQRVSPAIDAVNDGRADAVLRDGQEPQQIVALLHHACEQALLRRHTRSLVDELAVRNAELLGFNERLEHLVEERTKHLVEAQARLEESQRQMVQLETQSTVNHLLRGLAHEFNNPLAAIFGYAQRIRRQAADPDLTRRMDVILREIEQCRKVVQQLTLLSTPLSEPLAPCDPAECLREAARRLAATGGATPDLSIDGKHPRVIGAARALARVFEQALANARDAGATKVELVSEAAADRVRLCLMNDGETPDEMAVINAVRPFFTTRANQDRRGLGLSTAAALLREQDGTIELARRDDGPGAMLIVNLPAADPLQRGGTSRIQRALRPPTQASPGPPMVLVIDDEPMVAEVIVDTLRDAGITTATAGSVAEAMGELTRKNIGGLIIDLHLPDGSGLDLARRALALHARLDGCIVLTTGDNWHGSLERLVAEHGMPVLLKPFRLEEVRGVAARLASQLSAKP